MTGLEIQLALRKGFGASSCDPPRNPEVLRIHFRSELIHSSFIHCVRSYHRKSNGKLLPMNILRFMLTG